jgi:diguanylate cyclase (GGDEF)-like protein
LRRKRLSGGLQQVVPLPPSAASSGSRTTISEGIFAVSQLRQPLNLLLEITKGVAKGDPNAKSRLDEISASSEIPAAVVELAEQINTLAVQNDLREFRLELMIEDLLAARAALESARHDALTGLPNRGLFHELLDQACVDALRGGHSLALMFIDLDRFKSVNDTMGHDAGDELLIQVSDRLRACVRDGDTVARLGGDEFTVILNPLKDHSLGIQIAKRIVSDLQVAFPLSMGPAHIGGSVGMSFFPSDARQPVTLLKNADVAMYQAKEAGRNTYRLYRSSVADTAAQASGHQTR